MRRTLALFLLVAAWVVVLAGMQWDHIGFVVGSRIYPLSYLGVPLLGAALFLLLRPRPPGRPPARPED